jgi:hypothetical protein
LAQSGFTAEFEMGSGGALTLWSPSNEAGGKRVRVLIDALKISDVGSGWYRPSSITAGLSLMAGFYKREQSD